MKMLTSLDLLVITFMALASLSLLSALLMFVMKNHTVRRICLYVSAALALISMYITVTTCWPYFPEQTVLGVICGLGGIAAVVLERLSVKKAKLFTAARITAAVALIVGMINVFT